MAVADGVVYTGPSEAGPQNECCTLDATRESDGSPLAQYTVAGMSGSILGASGGLIYVGRLSGAVTAVLASDGTARWQFTTEGPGIPNVAAADGVTLISGNGPDSQGEVYALRSTDGTLIWKTPQGTSYLYQPVVAQGVVYAGADDGHVFALRERDGAPLWQYATGSSHVTFTPAVSNGSVYVEANGSVTALSAQDGTVIWRHHLDVGSSSLSVSSPSPAVADGVVYVSSTDGYLYALRADTGKELWRYHVGDWLLETPPLAMGGAIFYGVQPICSSLFYCMKGYLYALRASDGAPAWRLDVPYDVAPTYVTDLAMC
jgi:outer membrane protein assembly factor BamB